MGYTTPNAAAWDGWLLLLRHCCAGEHLFFHHCIGCGGGGGGGTDWGPQIPGRYKYKEWHHYAMSRNGNKRKMFYDGKEIGEKDWDSVINAIRADGEPLNIGSTGQPGDEYYLNGMMDDVAVFNFAFNTLICDKTPLDLELITALDTSNCSRFNANGMVSI